MKKEILTLAFSTLFISPVFASTWNYISAANEEALFFFDADTVIKNHDITTLWIKIVRTKTPDPDGSWATALRWQMNCPKRTIMTLEWSTYSKDGKFISSEQESGDENVVTPNSTGEHVLKIACEANFPRDISGTNYFKLKNNDVFQTTKNVVEYLNTRQDPAPK